MLKHSPSALAFIRMDLGITQQELADTVGISRALVAMAERGTRRLPEKARDYLEKLRVIAVKYPPAARVSKKKRPSIASLRPLYNRVPFSTRSGKNANVHIATIAGSLSVLSANELLLTADRLKEKLYNEGRKVATALDACHQLLLSLEQKSQLTARRMEMLAVENAAAPERAMELKVRLILLKVRLKQSRQIYKAYPVLRKRYRARIAKLYVTKLYLEDKREKFNRPAVLKRKQLIADLQGELLSQQNIKERINLRIMQLEG
jgi:transcriptional regulator with XRE-family HTH domain